MAHTIALIPGDGIGPEVTDAARGVIDAACPGIRWVELAAGAAAADEHGDVLPQATIEGVAKHRIALKGPVTTPVGRGFTSVNVQLRKRFDLFAEIHARNVTEGYRRDNEAILV